MVQISPASTTVLLKQISDTVAGKNSAHSSPVAPPGPPPEHAASVSSSPVQLAPWGRSGTERTVDTPTPSASGTVPCRLPRQCLAVAAACWSREVRGRHSSAIAPPPFCSDRVHEKSDNIKYVCVLSNGSPYQQLCVVPVDNTKKQGNMVRTTTSIGNGSWCVWNRPGLPVWERGSPPRGPSHHQQSQAADTRCSRPRQGVAALHGCCQIRPCCHIQGASPRR